MIDPKRILVICQAPNRDPFVEESEFLFKTLNKFGGSLSESKKIVCFSEPVSIELVKRFSALGVKIRIIEPIDDRCVHASKIQNLSVYKDEDFDFLVSLDTDMVIARDFSSFFDEDKVGAKPVDQDPLSINDWRILFEYFDLDLPKERYLTSFHMKETIPYFNSGVLLMPKKYLANLYESWKSFVYKLLDSYDELLEIKKHSFFTDQFALSLALIETKTPHNALLLEMNFPTHIDVHEKIKTQNLSPYLIHHHHKFLEKRISHCSYPNVNNLIDKINQGLEKSIEIKNFPASLPKSNFQTNNFDNKEFWNNRYETDPALGSGIGSRNENKEYKARIIKSLIDEFQSNSVLDVGCGDLEIVKNLPFKEYTGIDISETIIEKNKKIKPVWSFLCGNFLDLKQNLEADMVLCFDVLIHQHNYPDYVEFVKSLVNATKNIGIVSGYEWFPEKSFRSEITAYHEPISETLQNCGAKNIKLIGNYRQTEIFAYNKTSKID